MSTKPRRSGHATGMAGEFLVMEKLYRLGYSPALTLGNAKQIDILVKRSDGSKREISVKTICGGGKWGIGSGAERPNSDLIYVFLHYRNFKDPSSSPTIYVVPARAARTLAEPWFDGVAVYCSNAERRQRLSKYKDAWELI